MVHSIIAGSVGLEHLALGKLGFKSPFHKDLFKQHGSCLTFLDIGTAFPSIVRCPPARHLQLMTALRNLKDLNAQRLQLQVMT